MSNSWNHNPQKNSNEKEVTDTITDFNDLINPYENVLLKYRSVSWCFKLYTVSSVDLLQYQKDEGDVRKYVISQTGVTGKYSIDSVTMKSMPPGQGATKNNTLMQMSILLSEQGDMSFYDELQRMTLVLGYYQTMNVPLFLELSFKGFSDESPHAPIEIPEATRMWRLRINKIQARTDNNGGTMLYEITCTPGARSPYENEWRLGEQIEFTCGSTVGDFITAFEREINITANNQYSYMTYLFPNDIQADSFYRFFVHPDVADLILNNDSEQDPSKDKTSTGEPGSRKYSFKPQHTIGNAIDAVMDSAYSRGSDGKSDKRQFVHVIPVMYYVGYDTYRRKIAYRYEIYILPLRTIDIQDIDEARHANKATDLIDILNKNVKVNGKLNVKRYDYQWSGLNTEILDLNFDFNAAYNVLSTKNISSLFDVYNRTGAKRTRLTAADQLTQEQVQLMYQRKAELEHKEEGLTAMEEIELSSVNAALEEEREMRLEGETAQKERIDTFSDPTTTNVYFEDVSAEKWQQYLDNTKYLDLQAPLDYANLKYNSSSTQDSTSSTGEVQKRTAKSNYYNEAFLLKMDMQVVGDPHWLGKSDLQYMKDLRAVVKGQEIQADTALPVANDMNTDQCFLLNLYPVSGFDTFTQQNQQSQDRFMNQAIYRVLSIESRFDTRGFTQTLKSCIVGRSVNKRG